MEWEMTIFFNLENLIKESKGNPLTIMSILKDYTNKRILKYGLTRKLRGNSFLLHPLPLIEDKTVDVLYKIQYLKLAALRDYSMYSLYGIKSLILSYYPDLDINSIKTNPLLTITPTHILLKYEE